MIFANKITREQKVLTFTFIAAIVVGIFVGMVIFPKFALVWKHNQTGPLWGYTALFIIVEFILATIAILSWHSFWNDGDILFDIDIGPVIPIIVTFIATIAGSLLISLFIWVIALLTGHASFIKIEAIVGVILGFVMLIGQYFWFVDEINGYYENLSS